MEMICVGLDISKGYADVVALDDSKSLLSQHMVVDDTPDGHARLRRLLADLRKKSPEAVIRVGMENTGGLERNWFFFLRRIDRELNLQVRRINPLVIKRFCDMSLHQNKTDKKSAMDIARYLFFASRKPAPETSPELIGVTTLYRRAKNIIREKSRLANQLHILLIQIQPQLVRYCRQGFPQWVLTLLRKYPTAKKLARATVKKIAEIPYVTPETAVSLKQEARTSVGALQDTCSGMAVSSLAGAILNREKECNELKKAVIAFWRDHKSFEILTSIPGIAAWTAAALLSEIGTILRFDSPSALVAYSGVDPIEQQSGDKTIRKGISHRGNKEIRAALYPAILAAIQYNPVIREFYERLQAAGKPNAVAIVACMNKMLRIIHACLVTEKMFDPNHRTRAREIPVTDRPTGEPDEKLNENCALPEGPRKIVITAPVSSRQARRRREAARKQCLRGQSLNPPERETVKATGSAPRPTVLE